MVQPGGAVMPYEGIVFGECADCRINHLPSLSALRPEPNPVDHPPGRMIVTLFGKASPAMILGSD